MLPPSSCRALAPSPRGFYHSRTIHSLGASSEACGTLCLGSSGREIHHTTKVTTKRRYLQLRNPTSYSIITSPSLTTVRQRSTWGKDWDCHTSSFRHRPECSWVRATGDPASTPPDKECPACQENRRRPFVLSPREMLWQKKVEYMRQWVEKDPYDALFGKSNDRVGKLWHGWRSLQAQWPTLYAQKMALEDLRYKRKCREEAISPSSDSGTSVAKKSDAPRQSTPIPTGASAQSTPSSSNPRAEGVEWEFDPISMRRVPKPVSTGAHDDVASSESVDIPVKTFMNPQSMQSQSSAQQQANAPEPSSKHTEEKARGRRYKVESPSAASERGFNAAIAQMSLKESLESSYQALKELRARQQGDIGNESMHEGAGNRSHVVERVSRSIDNSSSQSELTQPRPSVSATGSVQTGDAKPHMKDILEQSWAKIRDDRRKRSRDGALSTATSKTEQVNQEIEQISILVQQQAHFRRGAPTDDSHISKMAYRFLNRRDRPYKHMTAHEFGAHKAALQMSWAKKHQPPATETPAEKLLQTEVETQKAAMTAYENKLSRSRGSESIEPAQGASQPTVASHMNISPKVETAKEREERLENQALVCEIRSVYEDTYGTIDATHVQGRGTLDSCLSDYESKIGNYTFVSGQDNFEHVAKTSSGNPIVSAWANRERSIEALEGTTSSPLVRAGATATIAPHATGYEEYDQKFGSNTYTFKAGQDDLEQELKTKSANPYAQAVKAAAESSSTQTVAKVESSGYEEHDRKLGNKAYIFVSGEDNIEQELKTKSANPYAAAVSKFQDTGLPLLTKLEQQYSLNSEVEATKPEANGEDGGKAFDPSDASVTVNQSKTPLAEASSDSQLYQILAYDSSDRSVHTAAASSSFSPPTGEKILPLGDALTRLHAPAKFLPHLAKLQANGYEVVSGNKDLLVLKRMRMVDNPSDSGSLEAKAPAQEPIGKITLPQTSESKSVRMPSSATADFEVSRADNSTSYNGRQPLTPQTDNSTSPTGFVNHDVSSAPMGKKDDPKEVLQPSKTSSRTTTLVRKEEPVFSGAQRRWDTTSIDPTTNPSTLEKPHESKTNDKTRTIISTAVIVLAGCYIAGFAIEELRSLSSSSKRDGSVIDVANQRSHGSGSTGLGLTDRAMWASPARGRDVAAEKPVVAGTGAGAMSGAHGQHEEEVNAAQWIGAALCVSSLIGLALQLFNE